MMLSLPPQNRQKRFRRNVHLAGLHHAFLAFLLLVEKFLLTRPVAAREVTRHVLAVRGDAVGRDDLAADRGLNFHRELLTRQGILERFADTPADALGLIAIDDAGQGL